MVDVTTNSFSIPANGKVYLKGNNSSFSTVHFGYYQISFAKRCNIGGELMSLVNCHISAAIFRALFAGNYNLVSAENLILPDIVAASCYQAMFYGCTSLVNAPTLPATSLCNNCYDSMFWDCTSLSNGPKIMATNLAWMCCYSMFRDCTSLVNAPTLLATTLDEDCYYCMFYGCTKLNYIKAMFITTPSSVYTGSWVYGVSSTGTFVKNAAATWNVTGTNGIPSGWTVQTA